MLTQDFKETQRRWEAYWNGQLIDRPVVWATMPKEGTASPLPVTYRERIGNDIEAILDRTLEIAEKTYFGGEALPQLGMSFGPDEIAVFCGAELCWSDAATDTNWSKPFVNDWNTALPLRLQEENPLWLRMLKFYRRGAERLGGQIFLSPIDFHSNLDLLAAVRGAERLCMDLIDQPDSIDRAMADSRRIFRELWRGITESGRMDEFGYVAYCAYAPDGVCVLACDFSALIGPEMFRRWVKPALEEESSLVRHAIYHWDGPRALVHFDEVMSIDGIHTIAFVPDPGESHLEYIDLFRRIQNAGKGVQVSGTIAELQRMHRELKPEKTLYTPYVANKTELNRFIDWLRKNT